MSATSNIGPNAGNGTGPETPLTPEVRKAYEDHYDQYEDAIVATNDQDLKASLMASQLAVAKVISADNLARIQQTTAAFEALSAQIKTTNTGLKGLATQIAQINSDISMYAGILGGIAEVLSLTGV